ncbi:hypothetical protein WDZ92_28345 [Nostoc sp. NIES-2111]
MSRLCKRFRIPGTRYEMCRSALLPRLGIAILLGFPAQGIAGAGVWASADGTGCLVWNPSPQAGETVTWSGACPGGKASGPGTEVFRTVVEGTSKEERYVGEMRDGKLNGAGTLYYDTGDVFEGDFADGARVDGKGRFTYRSGAVYEGMFSGGKFEGRGVFTFGNGDRYEGLFRGGLPNGSGQFVSATGDKISGLWKDGCLRQGTHVAAVGISREACGFR